MHLSVSTCVFYVHINIYAHIPGRNYIAIDNANEMNRYLQGEREGEKQQQSHNVSGDQVRSNVTDLY